MDPKQSRANRSNRSSRSSQGESTGGENNSGKEASKGKGGEREAGPGPQAHAALESLVAYLTVLLIGLLSAATAPL